jgi:hypothetical protein
MNSFLGEWRSKRKGPNRHNSQTDHTPNEIRIFFIFFIKALIKSQYSTHQHENKIFCKKKKKKVEILHTQKNKSSDNPKQSFNL